MERKPALRVAALSGLILAMVGVVLWVSRQPQPNEDPADDQRAAVDDEGLGSPSDPVELMATRKDPSTLPRSAVAGTVSDSDGNAIAGAQVCASLQDRRLIKPRSAPRCAESAADGSYRIDDLDPGRFGFDASAEGFQPARFSDRNGPRGAYRTTVVLPAGDVAQGIDFELSEGGAKISGVVYDVSGGVIPNSYVHAGSNDTGAVSAVTDSKGRFEVWGPAPVAWVSAWTPGYSEAHHQVATPGTLVELWLTPESVITGTVAWAESGAGVGSVEVRADGGFWSHGEPVLTQADGSFRMPGLQPGDYTIIAAYPTGTGQSEQKVHVGLGEETDAGTIALHPAYYVKGSVTIGDSQPCEGGSVGLTDRGKDETRRRYATADESGMLVLEGVLPGTYEVSVTCDGYLGEDDIEDVVVGDANLEGLHWKVSEALSIRGHVYDAEGEPVRGAWAAAHMTRAGEGVSRGTSSWGARTDKTGAYELTGLLPGTYKLNAQSSEFPNAPNGVEVTLEPGADRNDVDIELLPAASVRGTVTDETGTPVPGVSVRASGVRFSRAAQTNDAGEYEIVALREGHYTVEVERGWFEQLRAPGSTDDDIQGQRVAVVASEPSVVDLVVESQQGVITGHVVDERGEPVADAFITATRENESVSMAPGFGGRAARFKWTWNEKPVLTDQDGRFELRSLAENGKYTVRAARKGGGDGLTEGVSPGSDIEVAIETVGSIAGVVELSGGGHPQRFSVTAQDPALGVSESDNPFRTSGRFTLSNLPAGQYEVVVTSTEGNAKTSVTLGKGEDKTDVALTLTPRVTLRGTVVDIDTGEPIPGLRVQASSGEGGMAWYFSGEEHLDGPDVTDATGAFEVADAPTGKVMISVAPATGSGSDSRYGYGTFFRRIPAEPESQDVGKLEMIEPRLGKGEEAGDLGFTFKGLPPGREPEDRVFEVALVRAGGAAEKAGLQVGDVVVTIEGKDISGIHSQRTYKLMRVPAGDVVTLGLEGGEEVEITAAQPS